ncbi:MAG: serine/threonine-protein phosphatase [Nanoarchaeota archaeon]|nr:serine/threonine-protein phosphatase [Nanoarchaeota archaeon]
MVEIEKIIGTLESILRRTGSARGVQNKLITCSREVTKGFGDDFGVKGGRVYLFSDGQYFLDNQCGEPKLKRGYSIPAISEPFTKIMKEGIVLSRETRPELVASGIDYFLGMKADAGNYVLAWTIENERDPELFLSVMKAFRQGFKSQINAGKYQDQINLAKCFQKAFCDVSDLGLKDYDIAAFVSQAEGVGGDVLYTHKTKKGLEIVIGDSSAKSLVALVPTSIFYGNLASFSGEESISAQAMKKTNDGLYNLNQRTGSSSFITAQYIRLLHDEENRVMHYSTLGHHPPILLRDGKASQLKDGSGLLLGLVKPIQVERHKITLKEGDVCISYSDGVVEGRNVRGEMFGEERLIELVLANKELPAKKIISRIKKAVGSYSNLPKDRRAGNIIDDKTLVVIKVLPV